MDVIAAYESVGTFRGAAELCGTTHKTVKRIVERQRAVQPAGRDRGHNYDEVADLVAERVAKTQGRISAKRLLPAARAAGYAGSPRNFRRLVADAKQGWRRDHHRGRRPGVWPPGETLLIDWGMLEPIRVLNSGRIQVTVGDAPATDETIRRRVAGECTSFVAHNAGFAFNPAVRGRYELAAAQMGLTPEISEIIRDRNGRPIFEVFRYKSGQS